MDDDDENKDHDHDDDDEEKENHSKNTKKYANAIVADLGLALSTCGIICALQLLELKY